MGLAIISNNTTLKHVTMPNGTYTFPTNNNTDVFIVPAGTVYKIYALVFNGSPFSGGSVRLRIKDANNVYYDLSGDLAAAASAGQNWTEPDGATNENSAILKSVNSAQSTLTFKTPLILSAGQGLNFINTGGGAGAMSYSAIGEATQNTP